VLHLHHSATRALHLHTAVAVGSCSRRGRANCKDRIFNIDRSGFVEFQRNFLPKGERRRRRFESGCRECAADLILT
jgi:hypothetical protein